MKAIPFILSCILAVVTGCRGHEKASDTGTVEGEIVYARHFAIEKKSGYTILKIINPWQGKNITSMEYYLVSRGSDIPAGIDSSEVIFTPVKEVVCMSVTHLAMIEALGETGSIAAVSGAGLVYSEEMKARIRDANIPDVGYEAGLNTELIISISPDLVIMYGIGGESAGYTSKIEELGIKVLFNADYLEKDALAKAEWIKLFGALYSRESMADSIFSTEVAEYERIRNITAGIGKRPKIMLGLPYKDTWYVSPGNSYISSMIHDAGGEYLWQDTESDESMPTSLETVFIRGLKADYWLNIGTATSRQEIIAYDTRFSGLPCFRSGRLFNNNKRVNTAGGNDYWETGSVYPHLVLRDMVMIMHPELFSDDDDLFFYRKLE